MSTYRNRPRRDFTTIRNTALRDPRLSLKAKGLLALMLSFPDDWTYHLRHLETLSTDARDATRAAAAELEAAGYLTRGQVRSEDGKLGHAHYEVSDLTVDGKPGDGLTGDGLTGDGKPAPTKTEGTKIDDTKTDIINIPARAPTREAEEEAERQEAARLETSYALRKARNHSTALLAQQHPEVHAGLHDLQSVYAWKPAQYRVIATMLLELARDHGSGRVAAAINATLGSGAQIKQPLTYIRKILETAARGGHDDQPAPSPLRSLDDILGGRP